MTSRYRTQSLDRRDYSLVERDFVNDSSLQQNYFRSTSNGAINTADDDVTAVAWRRTAATTGTDQAVRVLRKTGLTTSRSGELTLTSGAELVRSRSRHNSVASSNQSDIDAITVDGNRAILTVNTVSIAPAAASRARSASVSDDGSTLRRTSFVAKDDRNAPTRSSIRTTSSSSSWKPTDTCRVFEEQLSEWTATLNRLSSLSPDIKKASTSSPSNHVVGTSSRLSIPYEGLAEVCGGTGPRRSMTSSNTGYRSTTRSNGFDRNAKNRLSLGGRNYSSDSEDARSWLERSERARSSTTEDSGTLEHRRGTPVRSETERKLIAELRASQEKLFGSQLDDLSAVGLDHNANRKYVTVTTSSSQRLQNADDAGMVIKPAVRYVYKLNSFEELNHVGEEGDRRLERSSKISPSPVTEDTITRAVVPNRSGTFNPSPVFDTLENKGFQRSNTLPRRWQPGSRPPTGNMRKITTKQTTVSRGGAYDESYENVGNAKNSDVTLPSSSRLETEETTEEIRLQPIGFHVLEQPQQTSETSRRLRTVRTENGERVTPVLNTNHYQQTSTLQQNTLGHQTLLDYSSTWRRQRGQDNTNIANHRASDWSQTMPSHQRQSTPSWSAAPGQHQPTTSWSATLGNRVHSRTSSSNNANDFGLTADLSSGIYDRLDGDVIASRKTFYQHQQQQQQQYHHQQQQQQQYQHHQQQQHQQHQYHYQQQQPIPSPSIVSASHLQQGNGFRVNGLSSAAHQRHLVSGDDVNHYDEFDGGRSDIRAFPSDVTTKRWSASSLSNGYSLPVNGPLPVPVHARQQLMTDTSQKTMVVGNVGYEAQTLYRPDYYQSIASLASEHVPGQTVLVQRLPPPTYAQVDQRGVTCAQVDQRLVTGHTTLRNTQISSAASLPSQSVENVTSFPVSTSDYRSGRESKSSATLLPQYRSAENDTQQRVTSRPESVNYYDVIQPQNVNAKLQQPTLPRQQQQVTSQSTKDEDISKLVELLILEDDQYSSPSNAPAPSQSSRHRQQQPQPVMTSPALDKQEMVTKEAVDPRTVEVVLAWDRLISMDDVSNDVGNAGLSKSNNSFVQNSQSSRQLQSQPVMTSPALDKQAIVTKKDVDPRTVEAVLAWDRLLSMDDVSNDVGNAGLSKSNNSFVQDAVDGIQQRNTNGPSQSNGTSPIALEDYTIKRVNRVQPAPVSSLSPTRSSVGSITSVFADASIEPPDLQRHNIKFVKDSSKHWYRPDITRETAVEVLKSQQPGSFVVRNSNSFPGAFALAIKVSQLPANIRTKGGKVQDEDLVRNFLIETTAHGVRIRGNSNEPVFGSLAALIYQHSITPISLPCKLMLPPVGPEPSVRHVVQLTSSAPPTQQLLQRGAAGQVVYIKTVDVESLTGDEAVEKAVTKVFETVPIEKLVTTLAELHVAAQGITLTDSKRRLFFRRHYSVNSVIFCDLDRKNRRWMQNDIDSKGKLDSRIFGFVSRKPGHNSGNECHVLADYRPEHSATDVVEFVKKMMLGNGNQ